MAKTCPFHDNTCSDSCALNDDGRCSFLRAARELKQIEMTLEKLGPVILDCADAISSAIDDI